LLQSINKILIIKLRAIGDVVLSTIVIPNLRQAFPAAQIDFLTESMAAEVVRGNPDLNQIIRLDRQSIQGLPFRTRISEHLKFIRRLHTEKYDLVFDFFGNPRSALLTWFTRAKIRVGYNWRGRQLAYNCVVPSRAASVHEAEFHLDALKALNIPIVTKKLSFPIDRNTRQFVADFWQQNAFTQKFVVGLNCSGGWRAKRWPLERFAALADQLVENCQASILLFWGPGEKDKVQQLITFMKHPAILTPPTSLKQLGAFIQQCQLIVSNDSGPMHIAAALEVPTVGIFGPTNPKLQGPYGAIHEIARKETLDCLACNRIECEHNSCMNQLTVAEVWLTVRRCIQKNKLNCSLTSR